MEEFIRQLLGEQNGGFHLAGIFFSIMGAAAVKWHYWQKHKAQAEGVGPVPKFEWGTWFTENWDSLLMSILGSFVLVRFIIVWLNWIEIEQFTFLGITIPITTDTVFYYLIGGSLIQIWIHVKYHRKKE